jgi:aspartate kinase
VGGTSVAKLYSILESLHIQPNLIQNGAITVQLCIDDKGEKTQRLASKVAELFDVTLEKGLTLLTIRHPNAELLQTLTKDRSRLLTQETPETVQVLMK